MRSDSDSKGLLESVRVSVSTSAVRRGGLEKGKVTMLKFILLVQIAVYLVCGDSSYDNMREKWLSEKCDVQIGGKMNLTVKEKRVDEILNVAKGTVMSRLFHARTNFKQAISRYLNK